MKTASDVKPAASGTHNRRTWLRPAQAFSKSLETMLTWLATAYRARKDMDQLARMSERELSDIGLARHDLHDMQAVRLGRDPTTVLRSRMHQRRLRRD